MPNYVVNELEIMKGDMEQVSGIFDSIKGNSETGVYTAQGVLALQEAGQARIRLKVKIYEAFLTRLAKKWASRIRQYWKEERFIGVTRFDGSYDVKPFKLQALDFNYDVKITAGSTQPVNRSAMLDLMIRLAQTQMPDGQNLVDREAVVNYLPEEAKSGILRRVGEKSLQIEQQMQQLTQMVEEAKANDEQTIGSVEELVGAVEQLKAQILQLGDKHDKLEKDKAEQEKLTKAHDDGYNKGYTDAEQIASPMDGQEPLQSDDAGLGEQLPDDILQGLEGMSDDELALLMQQNPEFSELIK
jgi:hypothetical protein